MNINCYNFTKIYIDKYCGLDDSDNMSNNHKYKSGYST